MSFFIVIKFYSAAFLIKFRFENNNFFIGSEKAAKCEYFSNLREEFLVSKVLICDEGAQVGFLVP